MKYTFYFSVPIERAKENNKISILYKPNWRINILIKIIITIED